MFRHLHSEESGRDESSVLVRSNSPTNVGDKAFFVIITSGDGTAADFTMCVG